MMNVRKHIVTGGILAALVASMLSMSPATAEEAPPPASSTTAEITLLQEPAADGAESGHANSPTQKPKPEAPVVTPEPGKDSTPEPPAPSKEPTKDPTPPTEPAKTPVQTPAPTKDPVKAPEPTKEATKAPAPTKAPEPTQAPIPVQAPSKAPAPVAPKVPTPSAQPTPAKTQVSKPAIAVTGAIAIRWKSLKGEAGALGKPTAAAKKTANYTSQQFAGGVIYATTKYGVQHILKTSAIGKAWTARGESVYGFPISSQITTAQGTYQKFSKNYWIFSNGSAVLMTGAVAKKWQENGGLKIMGMPKSMEKCGQRNNGCYQDFAKGSVFWSPATGAQAAWGGILSRYVINGGTGNYIGYPTSKEQCTLIRNGCYQNFERGLIMWSASTGAYSVATGAIRSHYGGTGTANGFLGFPSSNESCDRLGCSQRFEGGTIYWSGVTGAQAVKNGKLHNAYKDRNTYKGGLGFPRAGEVCRQLPKMGCYQEFSNGRLWSNTGQSYGFKTGGGIGASYLAKGGPNGHLGYPLDDEKCSGGQCAQTFQGGAIGWGVGASGTYGKSECQHLNDGRSNYSPAGSKHVLLTFTETYRQAYATNVYCKNIAGLYVTEWRTDGYVGASGFKGPGEASGPTRNLYSPTGSFTVTEAFGLGNPGTALSYRTLNPNSRWGGNPWTPTYNKYHESSAWEGWDENMWYFAKRSTRDYEQGAVINYNRPNIIQDAGFAIFLHQNKVPTAGCISIDDWAMDDYLRKSVPGDRIIMGVRSALFK